MAFIRWDLDDTPLEDPAYGEVKFIMKVWGSEVVGTFTELESHYCREDELNDVEGSNKNSTFYPVTKLSEAHLNSYRGRFKCLDHPEQLNLSGNYQSSDASNLMVVFDKCNNATSAVTCKSEAEINEFMQFKYWAAMWNTVTFV